VTNGRSFRLSLLLLGAGFNIDATREAGPFYGDSIYIGLHQIPCGYPLVANVLKICFGLDKPPTGKSVEDLFSEALKTDNYKPMEALVDRLMEADYYIAQRLATGQTLNSYRQFFEHFNGAQFLTFNYDSLPEIFLSQNEHWYPEDGYGLPVETELVFGVRPPAHPKSSSLVIHLHGSACVFTIESKIVGNPVGSAVGEVARLIHLEKPIYAFDPDSISHCFPRYGRVMSITGHTRVEQRVIAPIPDKGEDLKQAFIRQSYAVALPLVRQFGSLTAVGYSFNPYDRVSYNPILKTLAHTDERTLFIVSPQARELAKRISVEYPTLRVQPIERTFKGWAADSFRGL
jgi:hypothetical protein